MAGEADRPKFNRSVIEYDSAVEDLPRDERPRAANSQRPERRRLTGPPGESGFLGEEQLMGPRLRQQYHRAMEIGRDMRSCTTSHIPKRKAGQQYDL
jgi:hypothetical protein